MNQSFLESLIAFKTLSENDAEIRELERKAKTGDKAAAGRLITARQRAGHYPTKTHREVDEYRYGLKKLEKIHPDLLKKAHDHERKEAEMARENYRASDVPHHDRRRKMFADRLDSQPDLEAPNAHKQLHTWKRYMSLADRLGKLGNRKVGRTKNPDYLIHKFGSEQGKHNKPLPYPNGYPGPSMSAFERARERYTRERG